MKGAYNIIAVMRSTAVSHSCDLSALKVHHQSVPAYMVVVIVTGDRSMMTTKQVECIAAPAAGKCAVALIQDNNIVTFGAGDNFFIRTIDVKVHRVLLTIVVVVVVSIVVNSARWRVDHNIIVNES